MTLKIKKFLRYLVSKPLKSSDIENVKIKQLKLILGKKYSKVLSMKNVQRRSSKKEKYQITAEEVD